MANTDVGSAHDDPKRSVHDDPEIDFWVVLHYDPQRPDSNIFGNGPYKTKAEAMESAERLNVPDGFCAHLALVVPMFYAGNLGMRIALSESLGQMIRDAVAEAEPPAPVH